MPSTGLGKWKARHAPKGTFQSLFAEGPKKKLTDRSISQANVVLGHAGVRRSHPDYITPSVMNNILGGRALSSRLMRSVRIEQGLAYTVYSALVSHKESGSFHILFQTKGSSARRVGIG